MAAGFNLETAVARTGSPGSAFDVRFRSAPRISPTDSGIIRTPPLQSETPLPTNYVLIDFENVQPRNLEILASHPFKVIVFTGANQTKVPFDLAEAMQGLGENAEYVKIWGSGRNALDFHIAYYLGELSAKEPDACFHIISRDTGFDPLIKHLTARKIRVQREKDLAEIPVLRMANTGSRDDKIQAIVKNLNGRGQSRPRKVKTLENTINSLFTRKLPPDELSSLVEELEQRQYITVNDKRNVSYSLPQQP